ncbi:tRNA (adenosine(37)-N6)-dimethylallyltransferase MiaA [Variovorax sp. PvP013]|uniref:tRNA (adenosine(37)-N6)-dimethylallyltransferase MiaA n=1 Tax=Variovorax sp. PvP013 TaxID=3156435 RepID=UPI003D1C21E7
MPSFPDAAASVPPASASAFPEIPLPRYLALAGPTAAGKTAAALAIARALPVEIVSVDSALVYRGMDIGTAKPSAAERAEVPHHLIDIRDPRAPYSAAAFVADATRLISEIAARGRLPLLVGGTMLYFKALIDGIDAMPAADPAVRAAIEAEAAARGWPTLHARLAEVDPVTAARLAPHDGQRIQRALEVWRGSGRPLSSFQRAYRDDTAAAPSGLRPIALLSLEPTQRAWLHARIAERFDAMLREGLVDEVRGLRARGDLDADLPAMRCVGYRQTWELLDAAAATAPTSSSLDAVALDVLRERGVAATRQLAKRQTTWLRGMPSRTVIAADAPDAVAQAVAHALRVAAA